MTIATQHRHRRITERAAASPLRVDRDAGVIRGVKVLGHESANGRRYPSKTLQQAKPKYDGVRVFVDHPRRDGLGEDRSLRDWAGVIRNVRLAAGGLFGDLHLRRESEVFAGIIEAAERFPESFGLSHVVDAQYRVENGTEIIESIDEVFSVDLVSQPATTAGLFESRRRTIALNARCRRVLRSAKSWQQMQTADAERVRAYERSFRDRLAARGKRPRHRVGETLCLSQGGELPTDRRHAAQPARRGIVDAIASRLKTATDDQLMAAAKILAVDSFTESLNTYRRRFDAAVRRDRHTRNQRRTS